MPMPGIAKMRTTLFTFYHASSRLRFTVIAPAASGPHEAFSRRFQEIEETFSAMAFHATPLLGLRL